MEEIDERLTGKIQTLSVEQLTEVERFVESLQAWELDRADTRAWVALSSRALEKVWDNAEDGIYDAL